MTYAVDLFSRFAETTVMLRRWIAAATALIAVAAVSACGGSEAGGNGAEKRELNVGVLPVLGSAPYYIAKQLGFFKQEGLTVHEVDVAGAGPGMSRLLSGKLDVLSGAYESVILAATKGVRLRVVAGNNSGNPGTSLVMARSGAPVHDPRQLRGKTIGVNALDSSATMLTTIQLRRYGVPPGSVKYVVVPIPQMVQSLQKGAIDTCVLIEPNITTAEQQIGAYKVMDLNDGPAKDLPASGWFSTSSFARRHPKAAAAFQRAIAKGARLANDRRVVEQTAPAFLPNMSKKLISVVALNRSEGTISVPGLQRVADDMKQVGMLKKPYDVAPLLGK